MSAPQRVTNNLLTIEVTPVEEEDKPEVRVIPPKSSDLIQSCRSTLLIKQEVKVEQR